MKKVLLVCLGAFMLLSQQSIAQDQPNTITTAVPFVLISADARASGMGEQGVATSPDAYSQQWNPAKYAFSTEKQGIGVNYTPYLSQLVNDIFLGNLTYFNRINERSAFGASLKYFSLGEIELREDAIQDPLLVSPNEFTIDVSYALKLSDRFSMAVAGRYLNSNLRIPGVDGDSKGAGSFGIDIGGYYQSEEILYNNFDGRWRLGFNLSNIGPKIKYDDAGQENFIPTNMRLGGGFDFILDAFNTVSVGLEFNKLLVPTPPRREGQQGFTGDLNGNGEDNDGMIIAGQDNDVSFFSGIFQSFGDAPDGFSEELKEFTYSLGVEYTYNKAFSLRTGYFNESDIKGARKFATLGAGFEYSSIDIDVSYLFSTGAVRSPLENTLRFGITFYFGDEYDEY